MFNYHCYVAARGKTQNKSDDVDVDFRRVSGVPLCLLRYRG